MKQVNINCRWYNAQRAQSFAFGNRAVTLLHSRLSICFRRKSLKERKACAAATP